MVRFFADPGRSDIYHGKTFIYAWGSFLTATTQNEGFYILLHAHTVDRYVLLSSL